MGSVVLIVVADIFVALGIVENEVEENDIYCLAGVEILHSLDF